MFQLDRKSPRELNFRQVTKRELTLVDRSGFSVRLTLWGEQAKKYTATDQPVIAVKGVKVGDFGGAYLRCGYPSIVSLTCIREITVDVQF